MKLKFWLLIPLIIILNALLGVAFLVDERAEILKEMSYSAKRELIDVWYPKALDRVHGGYLSTFDAQFNPVGTQEKMIVTQARHIWSNSKAAIFYSDPKYKAYAKHGFMFLKEKMWDKKFGGFHTLVSREGVVKNRSFSPKEAYGNSFAIYALAGYYQASGDTSALNLAIATFNWLEKHSHDPVHKGYYQHMEQDGTPIIRNPSTPSTAELGYKDQNSSIHLLESFTELYTVWPDKLLKERLTEMFLLVRDKITTPKGSLTLFFTPEWKPVSTLDSSYASILKHRGLDHISFGHDVETAYLLLEASHILGYKHDSVTLNIGKKMVDHALANGWDKQLGGFYDEGYYFKDKSGMTIIKDSKNWWAQAEGLNTLLIMSNYFPNDDMQYFSKFQQLWKYTKTYLIDHENGDWYQGGLDKEPQQKQALKGQIWKGTYHNFRALMSCIQHLEHDKTAPALPANVKLVSAKKQLNLSWKAAKDDRRMLGYNIYRGGIRIGFTPLTNFEIAKPASGKFIYSIKAIDFSGNESKAAIFKTII